MKKLAIITKTTTINESSKRGFTGEYTKEKGRTIVIKFLGIPIFKSSLTIE